MRFAQENPAEHFYEHAFRFEEMLETLVLPLKQNREIDLRMAYTEETATSYREHRYQFREIDVILLEGIFLLKQNLRHHFDLACWMECSFETALTRAIKRSPGRITAARYHPCVYDHLFSSATHPFQTRRPAVECGSDLT